MRRTTLAAVAALSTLAVGCSSVPSEPEPTTSGAR